MAARSSSLALESLSMKTVTYATIASDIDLDPKEGMQLLRIGGAGNIVLHYPDGTTDTITNLLAGERLYVSPDKIVAAGSTATKVTLHWFERPVVHT